MKTHLTTRFASVNLPLCLCLGLSLNLCLPFTSHAQDFSVDWLNSYSGSGEDHLISLNEGYSGNYQLLVSSNSQDGIYQVDDNQYHSHWVEIDPEGAVVSSHPIPYPGASPSHILVEHDQGYLTAVGIREGLFSYKYWLVKTDDLGNVLWDFPFTTDKYTGIRDIKVFGENQVALFVETESRTGIFENTLPNLRTLWMFTFSASGDLQSHELLRLPERVSFSDAIIAEDGLYCLGSTWTPGNLQGSDIALFRFNRDLELLWERYYGGSRMDVPGAFFPTPDGHFLIEGRTESDDGDISAPLGWVDVWILKVDKNGELVRERTIGNPNSHDYTGRLSPKTDGTWYLSYEGSPPGDNNGQRGINIMTIDEDLGLSEEIFVHFPETDFKPALPVVYQTDGSFAIGFRNVRGRHAGDVHIARISLTDPPPLFTEILLSPNPTRDLLRIEAEALFPADFMIYNDRGQVMWKDEMRRTRHTIPVDRLLPGMYFVQIEGVSKSGRFIKM